ncbi:ABC transporter permease subunit [Geminocystis sp. NIES-3709]|uniref:ABC transporter permease subunit n=1 Tax=Geminocystis sp. NIES-3709 TaxID=1617448 RepID=UPI0037C1A81A
MTFNPFIVPSAKSQLISFKVGTEPTFPPFEMPSEDGSGLQGFDIDLMKAIGNEVGLEMVFESLPFDGLIPALQSNTIDAAVSGITITAERGQSVGFSSPYFKAGLAIAVQENNTKIDNFEDLTGRKIAVQIGTTGAMEAEKIPNAQIVAFDSAVLALQELVNGKVEAVVNDAPVTLFAIKNAGLRGVKVVGELVTEEFYGIALPINSEKTMLLNYGLFQILRNGTYKQIYQKWFAGEPFILPLIAPSLIGTTSSDFTTNPLSGSGSQSVLTLLIQRLPQGAVVTITLTALSIFFGLMGGSFIAFGLISDHKILKNILRIYVEFFRGTPMLVQLFIIYFGLPAFFQGIGLQWSLQRLPAAVIALSLNVAAYLAEIIRGGIQSIDKGQWEACEALGMNRLQTLKEVIMPQAFRRILPPLGNEFITLIKDTSLVAVIGFAELFRQGQLIVATTFQAFQVYIAVALVYLVLTTLSSFGFKWLEQKMDPVGQKKEKGLLRNA